MNAFILTLSKLKNTNFIVIFSQLIVTIYSFEFLLYVINSSRKGGVVVFLLKRLLKLCHKLFTSIQGDSKRG
jgi:hypothetical protein